MARVGQARKRDLNEKPIVDALRKVGASVIRISEKGAPDLLVFYRGVVSLLEVKGRLGTATAAQDATKAQGWPVVTVRTVDDGLRAVGAI
jgi:Holliday junction resolvase